MNRLRQRVSPRLDRGHPINRKLEVCFAFGQSAGRLEDLSGKRRHGTVTAALWSTAPRGGRGLAADGAGDNVAFASGSALATTTAPFSVSAWVYLRDFTGDIYPKLCTLQSSAGTTPFEITFSDQTSYDGVLLGAEGASWVRIKSGTTAASLLGLRHVVIVYNGAGSTTESNFSGRLDGAPLTFATAGLFSALGNANRLFMPSSGGANNEWDGWMFDFRIWSRALKPREQLDLWRDMDVGLLFGPRPVARARGGLFVHPAGVGGGLVGRRGRLAA